MKITESLNEIKINFEKDDTVLEKQYIINEMKRITTMMHIIYKIEHPKVK